MLRHSEASIEQCRLNILAVLVYHRFPMAAPFRVLACQPDRIMVEPGMKVVERLGVLSTTVFRPCRLDRKLHGPTAVWTMRENVAFGSMQITGHYSPATTALKHPLLLSMADRDHSEVLTWELDMDHGNPEYAACEVGHQDLVHIVKGFAAIIVHGCEVAWPGKTNPWWMRKRLLARGIQVPLVTVPQAV